MKGKTNSTMARQLRAVIYARFSSSAQRDASIDDQVDACTAYCDRNGYELVAVYADYALTGRSDDRPQFLQMVKDSESGKFDVVVVWKIDRFARNMMDQFHYERELKLHGVTLESCKENIAGGTMEADMNKGMLAIFAQIRSQQSAVDTMRGMEGKARQCQYLGVTKFGYSHEGDVITIDEANAPIAEQIHTDYLSGKPIKEIVQWLGDIGVRTSQKTPPGVNFVTNILKDYSYAGVYTWGKKKDRRGEVICDSLGCPIPLIRVEGGMPAIVSMAVKDACVDRMALRRHSNTKGEFWLTGKLYLGTLDKPMRGDGGTSKSGKRYWYYGYADPKTKKVRRWSKGAVESAITGAVRSMLRDERLVRQIQERYKQYEAETSDAVKAAVKAAKADIAALEKQKDNILNAVASGMPYESVRAKFEDIEQQIGKAQGRLKHVESEENSSKVGRIGDLLGAISRGALPDEKILKTFIYKAFICDETVLAVMNFTTDVAEQYEIEFALDSLKKKNTQVRPRVLQNNSGVGGGI